MLVVKELSVVTCDLYLEITLSQLIVPLEHELFNLVHTLTGGLCRFLSRLRVSLRGAILGD